MSFSVDTSQKTGKSKRTVEGELLTHHCTAVKNEARKCAEKCSLLQAGLESIPCWIADLSDEDAFMQLVLSNAQSELSPLEIGCHALEAVKKGNKWSKGGLKEYAQAIGKTAGYITQVRNAAEVLRGIKFSQLNLSTVLDKSQHLSAIHAADKELWSLLVEIMLEKQWSGLP